MSEVSEKGRKGSLAQAIKKRFSRDRLPKLKIPFHIGHVVPRDLADEAEMLYGEPKCVGANTPESEWRKVDGKWILR